MKNITNPWFDFLLMAIFVSGLLYLAKINSCKPEPRPIQGTNTIELENQSIMAEVNELRDIVAMQDSALAVKQVQYIQGKERIKYLLKKDTLTIHDTLLIEMTSQLDLADSIINLQNGQIDTLKLQITKLDKVISNDSLLLSMAENENEALSNTIKKQNRKIKGLKIAAVAAPIATILLILSVK